MRGVRPLEAVGGRNAHRGLAVGLIRGGLRGDACLGCGLLTGLLGGRLDLTTGLGEGLLGGLETGAGQVRGDAQVELTAGEVDTGTGGVVVGVVRAAGAAVLAAAEGSGDAVERRRELRGHDPHLGGGAVGDLGQGLEVLVGQQLGVGVAAVDGVEDLKDGARLTLGLEDRGLRLTLGAQDRGLLVTLGREDLGLLDTLGGQDRGAAVPLGAHLLLHGALDGGRRVDGLQLHAVDADSPAAGGLVQDASQLAVDLVAAGQRLLQVHGSDDIAQRGDRQLLNGLQVVGDLVGGAHGVGDLVVDHRVDAHHEVVGGDDGLRREGDDLLTQVHDVAHPVDEGHQEVHSSAVGRLEAPQALNDDRSALLDDPHRPEDGDDD